ncbi:AAA family ATPase [Bradyrhizobium brasilense]|uniref:AAA family ATPase n=1 Tax=Bradyrhizobium brasilense TaxID=1419277 RepID=A0ABY8JBW0_9BRAD|nr:AAA family ATPase [Bradyrhizobium brasilense]WFU61272.1 AAA family ATPase [Bradyrhizobium brasilense]
MQYINRESVPPPAPFQGGDAQDERREFSRFMRETPERLSQTTPRSRRFELAQDEILSALNELFKTKCAFCESRAPLNARLFRPAEEAEPLAQSQFAHLYYAWLRTDWGNVYAVCSACARAAGNRFPVGKLDRGPLPTLEELEAFTNENYGLWRWPHKDRRQLLDPCKDRNFARHLSFSLSGEIQALSKSGAQTIAVFNLDRRELVASRAATFDSYVQLLLNELERGISPNLFDFSSLEYGGGWSLLLRRVLASLGGRLDQRLRIRPDQIASTIARLWSTPIGREAIYASLDDVRGPVKRGTVARPASRGEPRRLIGVQVRNFKALENLELILPPPIPQDTTAGREAEASALLVLGENAAGKSSLLEAVALALTDERTRSAVGRSPTSFILDPALMGRDDRSRPSAATVRLIFEGDSELTLNISERFEEVGASDDLPPVFAYGAFRQYASTSPSRPPRGHIATLFRSESLLANPEEWLLDLPDDQFAMVVRALQRILVIEGDLEVVKRDIANRRCLILTKVGEGQDERLISTPLRVVSSGFRSVLAMVCDVLAGLITIQPTSQRKSFGELEAILLIDEVEAHLHPRWKMQIMAALRKVLPKATIIATTHDPLCLRGMHDQEVVVFNRALNTDAEHPDDLPVFVETIVGLPNVENLTVEQLLTSDFFSMYSTDSPVVELNLAKLGDLIARDARGEALTELELTALMDLRRKVVDALPLGSSEVERLVEEAVFAYIQKRRGLRATELETLKADTRDLIVRALEAY